MLRCPSEQQLFYRFVIAWEVLSIIVSQVVFFTFILIRALLSYFLLATITERWLWSAVFALLVASVVFVLLRTEPVKRLTSRIWFDHFRSVLYASCVAFGLVHLYNFRFTSLTVATLLLAPLLVLPQIISGFSFAFARMRLGMIWGIALHTAHNFVLLFTIGPVRPR